MEALRSFHRTSSDLQLLVANEVHRLHQLVALQDPYDRLRAELLRWSRGKNEKATAGLQRAQAHLKRHDPDAAIEICEAVR